MKIETTTPIERDAENLADLMPWYLNGTLSDEDRAWVDSQLKEQPDLARTLNLDRQISSALQEQAAEVPADLGWESLLRRVRADAAPAPSLQSEAAVASTFLAWLGSMLTPRVGLAMAVLLAVQTVGIGLLVNDRGAGPEPVEYRSVGGLAPHPVIRAVFADALTSDQLRDVLLEQGLSIVDGPNQLGEYQLVAGQPDLLSVAEHLKGTGVLTRYAIDQRVMARPVK